MWLSCLSPITVMSKARRWASTRTRLLCRLCDPVSDDHHLAFLTFVGIRALLAEARNGIETWEISTTSVRAWSLLGRINVQLVAGELVAGGHGDSWPIALLDFGSAALP